MNTIKAITSFAAHRQYDLQRARAVRQYGERRVLLAELRSDLEALGIDTSNVADDELHDVDVAGTRRMAAAWKAALPTVEEASSAFILY